MILVNQIFYVIFLLFIWFNTDAFISYSKLFRLSKLFKINSWEEYRMINPKMEYFLILELTIILLKIQTFMHLEE